MRSQHRTVLYKRHLRYWPLILLASDSRHLLKDFTSCCPTSQKTPFGLMHGNCPPGDRRRYTSRREGSFDSLGFVKPKLLILKRIGLLHSKWRRDVVLLFAKTPRGRKSRPRDNVTGLPTLINSNPFWILAMDSIRRERLPIAQRVNASKTVCLRTANVLKSL